MISVNINEKITSLDVSADTPILWVIRDFLKLTGTKFGCGKGLCGACTVLIDGQPVRSCITPISVSAQKKITTIEGLSEDGDHPLQAAWKEFNVPQCGYCQPGQIMNAVSLINANKKLEPGDIRNHMAGNICRCGTYLRIEKAILKASESLAT